MVLVFTTLILRINVCIPKKTKKTKTRRNKKKKFTFWLRKETIHCTRSRPNMRRILIWIDGQSGTFFLRLVLRATPPTHTLHHPPISPPSALYCVCDQCCAALLITKGDDRRHNGNFDSQLIMFLLLSPPPPPFSFIRTM